MTNKATLFECKSKGKYLPEGALVRKWKCPHCGNKFVVQREYQTHIEEQNLKITIKQVKERVDEISRVQADFEVAHSKEDSLYVEVLQAIADGHCNASLLAEEALKTQKLEFARHCA